MLFYVHSALNTQLLKYYVYESRFKFTFSKFNFCRTITEYNASKKF